MTINITINSIAESNRFVLGRSWVVGNEDMARAIINQSCTVAEIVPYITVVELELTQDDRERGASIRTIIAQRISGEVRDDRVVERHHVDTVWFP